MKEKLIKIGVVAAIAIVTIWSAVSIHLSKPKSEDSKVADNQGIETVEGIKVDFIEDFILEDLPPLKKAEPKKAELTKKVYSIKKNESASNNLTEYLKEPVKKATPKKATPKKATPKKTTPKKTTSRSSYNSTPACKT